MNLSAIVEARRKLAKHGKSIDEATTFYLDHLERIRRCNVTVRQLADEVVAAKKKDGHAPMYLADLRKRLDRFGRDFGDRPIAAITVEELDDWLRNLDCAPKTRANFRANVGVLFSYAERRRMIDTNPVMRTSRPKLLDKAPEIFSVDELTALLNAASTVAPDVLPMLAIGAFAGLRESEIKRLDWGEVNLQRGYIEVKAAKAKTAKRRVVRIQPNLAQWLAPYSAMSGSGCAGQLAKETGCSAEGIPAPTVVKEWFASFVRVVPTGGNKRRRCRGRRVRAQHVTDALFNLPRAGFAGRSGAVLEDRTALHRTECDSVFNDTVMPLPDQSPTVFVNVSTQEVTFRGVDPETDQNVARAAVRARLAVIEARLADYARETDRALEKFSAEKRILQICTRSTVQAAIYYV